MAEDVGAPAELDEIPHDQEVAGEAELLDERELVVDLRVGALGMLALAWAVAPLGASPGDRAQPAHLVVTRRARERRQVGRDQREVERARAAELGRGFDHAGVAREPAGLLGARAQVRAAAARQPPIDLVERSPRPHRSQRGGERATCGDRVVHVVRGDDRDRSAGGELGERVVAGRVERIAVIPQLDRDVVAAERVDETLRARVPRRGAVRHEGRGHRALATSGEHPPVTRGCPDVPALASAS